MTKQKTLPPEPEPKRRSDYGTFKTGPRDWDGWDLLGSMRWVRADTLGELWDPEHQPAIIQSPQEQLQETDPEPKKGRGGKRTGLPWPHESTSRMNATLRIVYKWEEHGFVKRWQPWAGQAQWLSLTEAGLYERNLPWHEIDWPEKERLRHDDRYYLSHIHRMTGKANAPSSPRSHPKRQAFCCHICRMA